MEKILPFLYIFKKFGIDPPNNNNNNTRKNNLIYQKQNKKIETEIT